MNIKDMDTYKTIGDYLENPSHDFENYLDFQMMAEDYKYQLLMEELKEEINS